MTGFPWLVSDRGRGKVLKLGPGSVAGTWTLALRGRLCEY